MGMRWIVDFAEMRSGPNNGLVLGRQGVSTCLHSVL